MNIKTEYGNNRRKICFETTDGDTARFIIKIRNESMTRSEFFRSLMLAYIDDHPLLEEFFIEYRKKKGGQNSREKMMQKERDISADISQKFGLDEDEIEDIYDIFEEEFNI